MKLKKVKLIQLVKSSLSALGYTEFKSCDAQGFFVKKLDNSLYLSLGLTIHRFYDSMFTGTYYLSPTTRWGTIYQDIPRESYERPGKFLTKTEHQLYLNDEQNREGVIDVWWDGFCDEKIRNFIKVIEITESRFANQPELITAINNSLSVQELAKLAKETHDHVLKNRIDNNLNFQPSKEVDGVPFVWYKAAETVLKKKDTSILLNKNTVIGLASDAWRQNVLDLYC